jgi:serine/threonine protein kinase
MGRSEDDSPKELPLFDGGEADTVRATADELQKLANKKDDDIARIDTDRQKLPSAVMHTPLPTPRTSPIPTPRPLASDELRRELSDGGFSRIDTLPDGFADILKRRSLAPGDVVGERYKLLEVLGGGAMGHVFTAENRAIGSVVAIKVLKPELLANPEFRQRFQYEAQAVGSIEHPNVARFLDVVVGDPTFLVMEYVPGETLATVLAREKAMSIQRAVHIATRLAWGLDAAHAAGIIHRDLKPANVILTADREVGETPKLIDFGLAKLAAVAGSEQLTRTGQIIGTPAYMSPEQISGRDVDARSDVYALACLLYEMIAGRPPFTGSDDVQTLYRQLHEPPEPLSLNAADISAPLDKVINRALAKNPHDRFGSMQELARSLNAAVEKRRGGGGGDGHTASTMLPDRRATPLPLAVAFVVGVALTAGAWAWRGAHHPRGPALAATTASSGGALFVASEPAGAIVSVDDTEVAETTPTVIRGLPAGMHTVRVTAPGRTAVEQHARVADGERALVEMTLPPASRRVRLETVPSGAAVYLNGVLQNGQTPQEIAIADDEFYQLAFEKDGFEMTERALTPDDREPVVTVNLQPEKSDHGTLLLDSDIVSEVWIDGQNSGLVSPTMFRLSAGEHTVQLRDNGEARSPTARVRIKVGRATQLSLKGNRGP